MNKSTCLKNDLFCHDASIKSTNDCTEELSLMLSEVNEVSFYWLDAWEADNRFNDFMGSVFMFGKLHIPNVIRIKDNPNVFEYSCCCVIREIPRILFLIPKNELDLASCYDEFNQIASNYRILEFSSRQVQKNLCFGLHNIQNCSKVLEIRYSRIYPAIPSYLKCKSFICISGSNANALESLLIENKIKGPCWLTITDFIVLTSQHPTWCEINLSIQGLQNVVTRILQQPPPTFTVLSICVKYIYPIENQQNREIVLLAYCVDKHFKIEDSSTNENFDCKVVNVARSEMFNSPQFQDLVSINSNENDYQVIYHSDERSMLIHFLDQLHIVDPDFILGHDTNFWLNLILCRAENLKVENLSRIGRLKRNLSNLFRNSLQSTITPGRVICDLCHSVKDLIKLDSYDISSISSSILNKIHGNINHIQVKQMLRDSTDQAIECIEHTFHETRLFFNIANELNVIQLAFQLTALAGNVMSRTLLGGRAERNDFLLLHAFNCGNYILPEKSNQLQKEAPFDKVNIFDFNKKKKSSYSGGLVFEPKKGLYNNYILVLDFNSLYPSLIQEYNICFSTVEQLSASKISGYLPVDKKSLGVIPKELELLVNKRKQVKLLMREISSSSMQYLKYDIRQKALKLTANSIYGCLGCSQSRFFELNLAALVTSLGREILTGTKHFVESNLGLEVIYGDTDSIMINTNVSTLEQVNKLGSLVKSQINEKHRLLEIDIDCIYKRLLLLRKKKYAALAVRLSKNGDYSESFDIKGLDIVRRDWCQLAKTAGRCVIEIILTKDFESLIQTLHSYLGDFAQSVRNNQFVIREFVIYKTLTKMPQDYLESYSYPHVAVAKWIQSNGGRIAIGHAIPYLICQDDSNNNPLMRAYHPDQLHKNLGVFNAQLSIDTEYYLSNQIFPVISRICSTIIDPKLIAEFLSIYSSPIKQKQVERTIEKGVNAHPQTDFNFCCPQCNCNSSFINQGNINSCVRCNNCSFNFTYQELYFAANLQFRNILSILYRRKQVCTDYACTFRTKQLNFIEYSEYQIVFCFKCYHGVLKAQCKPYSISGQLNGLCVFLSRLVSSSQFSPSLDFLLTFSRFETISLHPLF